MRLATFNDMHRKCHYYMLKHEQPKKKYNLAIIQAIIEVIQNHPVGLCFYVDCLSTCLNKRNPSMSGLSIIFQYA